MAGIVTDRRALGLYLAAVLAATLVHTPVVLGAGLALGLVSAGKGRWRLLRRAFWSVLAFNLSLSLGYVLVAGLRGELSTEYLLLVNLRVLLLVYLGFWLVSRINLPAALGFAPTLAFLVTLAVGQARTFQRLAGDFRLAFASRTPDHPPLRDRARLAGAQGRTLLDKSLAASGEIAQAMRSRGCFDD